MRAYSTDLRGRVLADCDAGLPTGAVSAKYRVSPAWVRRLKQRRRETGEVVPRRRPPRPKRLAAHAESLAAPVRERPDATPAELRGRLGVAVSLPTLWRALRELRLTLKKSPAGGRAGPARRRRPAGGLAR